MYNNTLKSAEKSILLRKQTPATYIDPSLGSQIIEPISVWKVYLAVKFTPESPKNPQDGEKPANRLRANSKERKEKKRKKKKRMRVPEWLGEENKQKKARRSKCTWIIFK